MAQPDIFCRIYYMSDCPNNFMLFMDYFRTEEDCIRYLASIRWTEGFVCPKCSHTEY